MIFDHNVFVQPSDTDADKMPYRFSGIILLFHFFFQCRKRIMAHIVMQFLMQLISRIPYGLHVGFFLRKMLQRIVFEVLNALPARMLLFLFLFVQHNQFAYD